MLEWSATALRDMRKLAKRYPADTARLRKEAEHWAAGPVRFPDKGRTNFRWLVNHRHEARLRVGDLRALMDRRGRVWVVARVLHRDERTYK